MQLLLALADLEIREEAPLQQLTVALLYLALWSTARLERLAVGAGLVNQEVPGLGAVLVGQVALQRPVKVMLAAMVVITAQPFIVAVAVAEQVRQGQPLQQEIVTTGKAAMGCKPQ
jgi:hypothetical protein